jgi:hypothetical protein
LQGGSPLGQTPLHNQTPPYPTRLPNTTPHSALASRSFSDQSSPRSLSPRRVHRPRASSTLTAARQHHRWLPPLRTSPNSSWPADLTRRASSYVPECATRHCCTNTFVCRARRTRCKRAVVLSHSAREVTQLSAWTGTVLGWVYVCTVPQGAQLSAAGWTLAALCTPLRLS